MEYYLGCDLGGTNLRAGLVNANSGEVLSLISVPTVAREGHTAVMARIANLLNDIVRDSGIPTHLIRGIGIGAPGALDIQNGRTLRLPNFPGNWPDVPVADTISAATNLPVYLINDVRAITFGEWRFGAGHGANTMACIAIGTGIGGGLILDQKLHLGYGGKAGEVGHTVLDPNGPRCGCGGHGCVETYASGPAIAAMGLKAITQGLNTNMGALVDYDLNRITPKVIYQAALEGDTVAREIFDRAGQAIGLLAANLIVAVGPDTIVIGGGVAQAGEILLDPIRRTIRNLIKIFSVDEILVVPARLGNDAGVIGSAMWARERNLLRAPTRVQD
jgi:glucokinase